MPTSRFHGGSRDVLAADTDAAAVGMVEAGDQPQQRRLAAAGGAEKREELARPDVEVDVLEHVVVAVGEVDAPRSGRRRLGAASRLAASCPWYHGLACELALAAFDDEMREDGAGGDDDDCDDAERRARATSGGRLHEDVEPIGERRVGVGLHQHQGRRQFDGGGGEAGDEAGQDAARHQRQDDAAQGARLGGAEVFGGLLQRDRNLLQRRIAGAQRVGQAADRKRQHDHDPERRERRAVRQLHAVKGAQIADAEHDARDGERGRRRPVEPVAADQLRAQHEIGDRGADHDVDQAGERGIDQRVLDVERTLAEHAAVMRERKGVRQRRERPDRREGQQQQADMRRQHEQQDQRRPRHRR